MNTIRNGVVGMLAAFAVVAMVMGALSLGLLEGSYTPETTPTPRLTLPPPNLTPIIGTNPTREIPSPVVLKPATPTLCPQPSGWEPYIVMAGDNLTTLAETRGYSLEQILTGNCLISEMIIPEKLIYLPPAMALAPATSAALTVTPTLACQRPTGWTVYVVKRGDTLTRISVAYRVTISYLKQINCLLSDTILPGWTVWVPNVATSTFTASPTATEKPTETETPTWTVTITNTVTLTATVTPSRTSTATPTMTPTFTDPPTVTSTPTETTVLTATPTATHTPADTPTATPEPTSLPTQP